MFSHLRKVLATAAATALFAIGTTGANASVCHGFTGLCSPDMWQIDAEGDSMAMFSLDGTTLEIRGSDSSPMANGTRIIDVTLDTTGKVFIPEPWNFSWDWFNNDIDGFDIGYYLINGTTHGLASNAGSNGGNVSEIINPGDIIGFRITAADDFGGAAHMTITGFSIPEPVTLAIFGAGLVFLGFARRRKAA